MKWIAFSLLCLSSCISATTPHPLSRLVERGVSTQSDTVLVIQRGEVLVDRETTSKILDVFSITKSIVSLSVGILVDEKKIHSIDDPVYLWYPEWDQGAKRDITLRHLLTHTSGLQTEFSFKELFEAPDCVQQALDAPLMYKPGTKFLYNNKAINLLSGIVEKVARQRLDLFVRDRIFDPLQIEDFTWEIDKSNHAFGHSGLSLRAKDLAKIGQLILQEGRWKEQTLISKEWLKLSMEPSHRLDPLCGLLWWRWEHPHAASAAIGYLGQYLVIIPETQVIGVRQVSDSGTDSEDRFDDFPELLLKLR